MRHALCALLLRRGAAGEEGARIGYLSATNPASESARSEAIRLALRELGYIEKQNITIEYRFAEQKNERLAGRPCENRALRLRLFRD